VAVCPFGAMRFDVESRKSFKCDACTGDPACVGICPTAALSFQEGEAFFARQEAARIRAYACLRTAALQPLKQKKRAAALERA
jgi:Fe-S-cluster-containing hydrogenase component 2